MRWLFALCSQTSIEVRDQNEGEGGKREIREMLALPWLLSGGVPCPGLGLLLATQATKAEKASLEEVRKGAMGCLTGSSVEHAAPVSGL